MKKFFSQQTLEIIIILLLGLTPLLWFHGKEVILGHDAGLPLSPIPHFIDRLSLWTQRLGFGHDQSIGLAGFFIHGFEALVIRLGASLQLEQKITFIFWFVLPGFTMYYLASKLAKKLDLHFFTLPVTIFYMFNHFLLQGWFIAERTKFSLFAALPLLIAFLFDWNDKRYSTLKTALFISATFFFLNGEASLPLFGGVIVTIIVFLFFYLITEFSKEKLLRILILFITTVFISIFLQAYWLLPFSYFVLHSYSAAVKEVGGVGAVVSWISYVSQDSSLVNIFRLQGIPEWYQNSLHPYARFFLYNPLLIIVGFLIPFFAFAPLELVKDKQTKMYVIFFAILAIVSMVFVAGSHRPLGTIYVLFVKFIPGFIAFRTPYYKFASSLWFAYAILIGFCINILLKRLSEKKKIYALVTYFLISIGIILYSFPFLSGSFFNYMIGQRSMKVVVPQYVFDFGKWSETPSRVQTRVLALPVTNRENQVDTYSWGYWSLTPLTSLLTDAPIVNTLGMSSQELELTERLDTMMANNSPGWINLAKLLGIQSFLIRKDFSWNVGNFTTNNPLRYENALHDSRLTLARSFGPWEVYDFIDTNKQENISISKDIGFLQGPFTAMESIVTLPNFNPNQIIFHSSDTSLNPQRILPHAMQIYITPSCILCNLRPHFIDEESFIPALTAGSRLYPIVLMQRKRQETLAQRSLSSKADYYIEQSLRDQKAIQKLLDEKKSNDEIQKQAGEYDLVLKKLHSALAEIIAQNSLSNNDLLLKAYGFLHVESINVTNIGLLLIDKLGDAFVSELFTQINDSTQMINKNSWFTTEINNKKYILNSPKTSQYKLLINGDSLSDESSLEGREIPLTTDGLKTSSKAQGIGNGWYSLNVLKFSQGLHTLSIADEPQANLFPNDSPISVVHKDDQISDCYKSSLITSSPSQIYRFSFLYKQDQGLAKYFFDISQGSKIPLIFSSHGMDLQNDKDWNGIQVDYQPSDTTGFYFYICTRPNLTRTGINSILELKNVVINRITSPEILLVSENSTQSASENSIDIKSKAVMLNQSYNSNWQIDSIPDSPNVVNGYANGWFITSDANNFTVSYKPQELVNIGFFLTGISLAGLGIGFVFSFMKKKR